MIKYCSDNSAFGGNESDIGLALAVDNDNNLFVCGRSTVNYITEPSEWCDTPQHGAFPMCDHNGMLYTETDIANASDRAFIAAFPKSGELLWSTQYGNGNGNSAVDIFANSQLVWIVGSSNKDWTFEEYDETPGSYDYFREIQVEFSEELPDATIARFDIPIILNSSEVNSQLTVPFTVYPNPSGGLLTLEFIDNLELANLSLAIYNTLGQLIVSMPIGNKLKTSIDISALANGCYSLRLEGLTTSYSTSIIKQ